MSKLERKTLLLLTVLGHRFKRYLFSNEYAAEMKCVDCGYIIWPCYSQKEVIDAMKTLSDEVVKCAEE
jgi:macrodomain Ter protein organizer (MatP/YcbG family)